MDEYTQERPKIQLCKHLAFERQNYPAVMEITLFLPELRANLFELRFKLLRFPPNFVEKIKRLRDSGNADVSNFLLFTSLIFSACMLRVAVDFPWRLELARALESMDWCENWQSFLEKLSNAKYIARNFESIGRDPFQISQSRQPTSFAGSCVRLSLIFLSKYSTYSDHIVSTVELHNIDRLYLTECKVHARETG